MTTIAINHHMIAADSLRTRGQERCSGFVDKIVIRGDWLYANAGLGSEGFKELLYKWNESGADPKEIPLVGSDDAFTFLAVKRGAGKPIIYTDRCKWADEVDLPNAFGSGREYALGCLDAGMSPIEAVHGAIKRDLYSGGPVLAFDLKTFQPITQHIFKEAAE